jgi:hypothetical protein
LNKKWHHSVVQASWAKMTSPRGKQTAPACHLTKNSFIDLYLNTPGGKSPILYLNVVDFLTLLESRHLWQLKIDNSAT